MNDERPSFTHVCQKSFEDGSVDDPVTGTSYVVRQPGEVINAYAWAGGGGVGMTAKLESQRYIATLPGDAEPVEGESGRWWIDEETRDRRDPVDALSGEYPKHRGGGKWELSNGDEIELGKGGRPEATRREAALQYRDTVHS